MKRITLFVLAMPALFLTSAAHAQTAPQVTAPCELHIIVGQAFVARGHFARVGPGAAISGYLKPYEDVEAMLREYLAPEIQAEVIRAAGVPSVLGLTGYQVIVEPPLPLPPPDPAVTIKDFMAKVRMGPRLSESRAPCYAEIRVISQMYEKTALSRMIYSWLVFRQFDGDRILFEHNTAKATQVDSFPAKTAADEAAARADARKAFRANLLRFLSSGKFNKLRR
jgi:hypothetical protein